MTAPATSHEHGRERRALDYAEEILTEIVNGPFDPRRVAVALRIVRDARAECCAYDGEEES
jgi:hypothetical protein